VGVILNLSVWAGLQIIFPARAIIDPFVLTVALFAGYGLIRRKWDPLAVIITGAGLGVLWSTLHRWL
jgi:hypothetical protein